MLLHDPTLSKEDAIDRVEELILKGFVGVRYNPYLWPAESSNEDFGKMSGESGLAVYKRCGELNIPVGVMCFKGLDLHYDDIINLLEQSPGSFFPKSICVHETTLRFRFVYFFEF